MMPVDLQTMMEHPFFLPAVGAAVLLMFTLSVTLGLLAGARARREGARLQARIEELFRENRAAAEVNARLTRRLEHAEEQIRQLQVRIDTAQTPEQPIDPDHAYSQAIRMVRRGADADRLVADFGLSRGEADLVALMHGKRMDARKGSGATSTYISGTAI